MSLYPALQAWWATLQNLHRSEQACVTSFRNRGQGGRAQRRKEMQEERSEHNCVCSFHPETPNSDYQQSQHQHNAAAQHKARHRHGHWATVWEPGASQPCKGGIPLKTIERTNFPPYSMSSSWHAITCFQPQTSKTTCCRGCQCCKGRSLGCGAVCSAHEWRWACAKHLLKQYRKTSWKGPLWYMSISFCLEVIFFKIEFYLALRWLSRHLKGIASWKAEATPPMQRNGDAVVMSLQSEWLPGCQWDYWGLPVVIAGTGVTVCRKKIK